MSDLTCHSFISSPVITIRKNLFILTSDKEQIPTFRRASSSDTIIFSPSPINQLQTSTVWVSSPIFRSSPILTKNNWMRIATTTDPHRSTASKTPTTALSYGLSHPTPSQHKPATKENAYKLTRDKQYNELFLKRFGTFWYFSQHPTGPL